MATYSKATSEYIYNIETKATSNSTTTLISTVPAGTWYELMEWQAYCHDGTALIYLNVETPGTLIGGDEVSSNQSAGYGNVPYTDKYVMLDFTGGTDFDAGDTSTATSKGTQYVFDSGAPFDHAFIKLNGTYGTTAMSDQHQCHWKKEFSTGGCIVKEGQSAKVQVDGFTSFSPSSTEFVQVVTWWKKIVGYEG